MYHKTTHSKLRETYGRLDQELDITNYMRISDGKEYLVLSDSAYIDIKIEYTPADRVRAYVQTPDREDEVVLEDNPEEVTKSILERIKAPA